MKLSNAAIAAAGIGAFIMPFAAPWLFLSLIVISMTLTGIGLIIMQRQVRRNELKQAMDKAFGKPQGEK